MSQWGGRGSGVSAHAYATPPDSVYQGRRAMMNRTHGLTYAGLFFLSACSVQRGDAGEDAPDEDVFEVAQANHGCPNYEQSGNHLAGSCAADFEPLDCAAWCAAQDPSCTVSPGNGTVNVCEDQSYPG